MEKDLYLTPVGLAIQECGPTAHLQVKVVQTYTITMCSTSNCNEVTLVYMHLHVHLSSSQQHMHTHMYIGEAVSMRLAGGHVGNELVVIQGDRFDVHFECVDMSGSLASQGTCCIHEWMSLYSFERSPHFSDVHVMNAGPYMLYILYTVMPYVATLKHRFMSGYFSVHC